MSVTLTERRNGGGSSSVHRITCDQSSGVVSKSFSRDNTIRWGFASLQASVIIDSLRSLFLPHGEVSTEYLKFQVLDSIQAMCSYLRGVLTIHATLTGVGAAVGAEAAAAATIAFILKDGSAMLGSLCFNYLFATGFDGDLRFWRLFADLINDVGLTLELLAPLTGPRFFLATTCAANVCKALCGVAAGATRVAISQHFAVGGEILVVM